MLTSAPKSIINRIKIKYKTALEWDNREFTAFYSGYPSGNQGNFYMNFCLPTIFNDDDQWTMGTGATAKAYTVEDVGTQTIDGQTFPYCIKATIDDSGNSNPYLRGNGHFILVRDVDIVELVFRRGGGTTVSYQYLDHTTAPFRQYTLSGTATDDGSVPVAETVVAIANADWGSGDVTGPNGAFSIQVYGPDVVLRIWDDPDSGYVWDYDANPLGNPYEYCLTGVNGDRSNLDIDISLPSNFG